MLEAPHIFKDHWFLKGRACTRKETVLQLWGEAASLPSSTVCSCILHLCISAGGGGHMFCHLIKGIHHCRCFNKGSRTGGRTVGGGWGGRAGGRIWGRGLGLVKSLCCRLAAFSCLQLPQRCSWLLWPAWPARVPAELPFLQLGASADAAPLMLLGLVGGQTERNMEPSSSAAHPAGPSTLGGGCTDRHGN